LTRPFLRYCPPMAKIKTVASGLLGLLLIGAALFGCGGAGAGEVSLAGDREPADPMILIHECEDGRVVRNELLDLADYPDSDVRARLALALGRIGSSEVVGTLVALAGDGEEEVAQAALAGLALSADRDGRALAAVRAAGSVGDGLLVALGELGEARDAARLTEIANREPDARANALRALGVMGNRGVALNARVEESVAAHLRDPDPEVRLAAAFALYRSGEGSWEGAREALKESLDDPDEEVRAYALRAVARRGGLGVGDFLEAVGDPDQRVSAGAFSALPFVSDPARCEMVLGAADLLVGAATEDVGRLLGPGVHAMRAAVESLDGCEGPEVREIAGRIEKLTDAVEIRPLPAGVARIRCRARYVAGKGDLSLVACDPARPHNGKRLLARRLGERGGPTDLETLSQMADDPDPRVVVAALDALASTGSPEGTARVLIAAKEGGVLIAAGALDALAMNADEVKAIADGDIERRIFECIDAVVDRFALVDHGTAALVSAAAAIRALDLKSAEEILDRLVADERPPVRWAVLEAYGAFDEVAPPEHLPSPRPVRPFPLEKRARWEGATAIARLRTTQGEVTIRLLTDVAPATVASFVELASEGYFSRTEIHRVVPNFVVQAGDPTGTGLGDPGYSLRCEISGIPYERGTVGMALSGKDTGGSQFFIALSRQPHLDWHYTVFGQVISGIEVVDAIEEGDEITAVYLDEKPVEIIDR